MTSRLSRQEISDTVGDSGWRLVLEAVRTTVPVTSLAQGAEVAARAVAAAGDEGAASLWMDVRADRVVLTLQSPAIGWPTPRELDLARAVSAAVGELGLRTHPGLGDPVSRPVQMIEIAIDALDIAAIRPFWKAVMGYTDAPGASGPDDAIADPLRQGPAIWFQQMDAPRPQRNRIHLDISVPHEEAGPRVAAALAAGGVLLSDAKAPAFWVLADAEGNEACVTTWQGRE
ncbi:VOC family protein [Nonomuraea sp. NPDC003804]|uniref:VOC family protein n=1 Tax=Nonomuraea sp. NPDC003804 TaxID=3154547 RepID=UPI0033A31995